MKTRSVHKEITENCPYICDKESQTIVHNLEVKPDIAHFATLQKGR